MGWYITWLSRAHHGAHSSCFHQMGPGVEEKEQVRPGVGFETNEKPREGTRDCLSVQYILQRFIKVFTVHYLGNLFKLDIKHQEKSQAEIYYIRTPLCRHPFLCSWIVHHFYIT